MAFPRKPWTFADEAELKQIAESGLNRIEIARRLNRSVGAIEVRASALGIRFASNLPTHASATPRLRKYFESLAYGKRTGRIAYVMDAHKIPEPIKGGEWAEDKQFNATNEILARPALK